MDSLDITIIPHKDKIKVWDSIYPMLSKADDPTCKAADLLDDILEETSYEILIGTREDTLACVFLIQAVSDSYYVIKLASDDKGYDWHTINKIIEARAKQLGLTHIAMTGRKGWMKILPEYKVERYLYMKEIG